MRDVRVAELGSRQFNRVSRGQLLGLGVTEQAIKHRVEAGRLFPVEQGVFALAPPLEHDDWGRWMGATLTAPGTVLSHQSAAAAQGLWTRSRPYETVTRPGNGGPRLHSSLLVYRSTILPEARTTLNGVPITTMARTVFDLARGISDRALARLLREAVRTGQVTLYEVADEMAHHPRRRGIRRLARTIARYAGLPLERARSGAEIRAMEVLSNAGRPLPDLNVRIAGEEADLSWRPDRLIIEIDGGPFHLDRGEDARKEQVWQAAGWTVLRLPSDAVHAKPQRLLALAPPSNVPPGVT